jgi:hypothetical protein
MVNAMAPSAPSGARRMTKPTMVKSTLEKDSTTARSGAPRVPRVVGLGSSDARQVLCSWRIRTAPYRGGGQVVGQRPRPGAAYRVPTGAVPNACTGLPDRPLARLTIR